MGYFTEYELDIIEGPDHLIELLRAECEGASFAISPDGATNFECKWYEHQKDMKAFSKKHPDALLMLSGEGEDNGDAWREYYRNGKMQVCKAVRVFPDYDPALLED